MPEFLKESSEISIYLLKKIKSCGELFSELLKNYSKREDNYLPFLAKNGLDY
jgi:hypothetical protein